MKKPLLSTLDQTMKPFDVMRRCLEMQKPEEELPEFDPSKCTCATLAMPPCSYCESGNYKEP